MALPPPGRSRTLLLGSLTGSALLAVGLAGPALAATPAPDAADLSGLSGLSTVTQNVLPGLATARSLGTDSDSVLNLLVSVKRPDVAGERVLLTAEHTPGTAAYGHYLTPAQFAARFGVPAAQRSAVRGFLTGGGLSVDSVSAAGDQYSVHGTTGAIGSLLHTSFGRYVASGTTFVANTAAPVTPASLGISNVIGLNTLQRYRTRPRPPPASPPASGPPASVVPPPRTCGRSTTSRSRTPARVKASRSSARARATA